MNEVVDYEGFDNSTDPQEIFRVSYFLMTARISFKIKCILYDEYIFGFLYEFNKLKVINKEECLKIAKIYNCHWKTLMVLNYIKN